MANITNKNFLSYTKLTYADILDQINSRLNREAKFENFRESAIAQTMVEIFAATADMVNYYIERRAEETAGFETAQLKSSIIALAKQLGYVIQRPVPASSSLRVILKGPITSGSINAGDTISFTKFTTKFTYNNLEYTLKKTYQYTFTSSDVTNLTASDYSKTIDGSYIDDTNLILDSQGNVPTSAILPIEIVQGKLTSASFTVPDNSIFQEYTINDTEFSNFYGVEDISYDSDTNTYDLSQGFTKVGVGSSVSDALETDANLYEVDRRSLLTADTVLSATSQSTNTPNIALIRTRLDEGVDIVFGDDIISNSPNLGQVVAVQYLATAGSNANETGVVGKKLSTTNAFTTNTGYDVTNNVEFRFNSNIVNGADMESIDSIKLNAPSLFYSLDRLVSKSDYITYLKSLTTPIDVKNAIVWGEQEEARAQNVTAIQKLFNVVLYSVIGSMYYKPTDGTYAPKSLSATTDALSLNGVVLEGTDYSSTSEQSYFNILVKGNGGIVTQLGTEESYSSTHPVSIVKSKLKTRSQITTRNIYISPIIQNFYLAGNIYINNLSNINTVKKKINNAIYDYLDDNADFTTEVYISKIVKLIEDYPEIVYADVYFDPVPSTGSIIESLGTSPEITANASGSSISGTFVEQITAFIDTLNGSSGTKDASYYRRQNNDVNISATTNAISGDASYDINEFENIILPEDPWQIVNGFVTDEDVHYRVTGLTERTFYNTLMKNIYTSLGTTGDNFRDTTGFISLMTRLNNQLKKTIRKSMIDSRGNITNFSLRNEIPKIEITANYTYRS